MYDKGLFRDLHGDGDLDALGTRGNSGYCAFLSGPESQSPHQGPRLRTAQKPNSQKLASCAERSHSVSQPLRFAVSGAGQAAIVHFSVAIQYSDSISLAAREFYHRPSAHGLFSGSPYLTQ